METCLANLFLDLTMVKNYWAGAKRAYHHTAPVSSVFPRHEALNIVLEEGLETRWARHQAVHQHLRTQLEKRGFRFLVDKPYRLPNLNAVFLPEGIDEAPLRSKLLDQFNIEVGGGLGAFAGKLWRVGIMGESATKNHVNMLTSALDELM